MPIKKFPDFCSRPACRALLIMPSKLGNYNSKKVIIALSLLVLFSFFGITDAFNLFTFKKDPALQAEQQLRVMPNLPAIEKNNRVMILAPHPDDEILSEII